MKFQVFNIKDPRVKVITVIEAASKEEANQKARRMNPDYARSSCFTLCES
jgi:hypothetical protein